MRQLPGFLRMPGVRYEPPDTPRCEAERVTRYWSEWESQHPDKRCLLSSKFEHEGHFYCQRHAALLALGKMLRDGELDGAGKSAAG